MARIVERSEWAADPLRWVGEWEGGDANISVIFHTSEGPGHGPGLHWHPYPETFIIQEGSALFTIGDLEVEARPGQILVAPAKVPHGFKSVGPGIYRSINIHTGGTFITHWL